MADDLFGNPNGDTPTPTPAPTETPTPAATDPYAHLLQSIQAPDGRVKYNSTEDALKSIPEAQAHVQTLSQKVKELETQLAQKSGAAELAERLAAQHKTVQNEDPVTPAPTLDEATIKQLAQDVFKSQREQDTQAANKKSVVDELSRRFKDKAPDIYRAKAEELGVDVSVLTNLAALQPKAVLAYFEGVKGENADPTISKGNPFLNEPEKEKDPMEMFMPRPSKAQETWAKVSAKYKQ